MSRISAVVGLICVILIYKVWDPSFPFLYESGVGKKAIVIGATAGMGRETARLLMQDGYCVGCVGRRRERLDELKDLYSDRCVPCVIDMSTDAAIKQLEQLIVDMGGCDLMMVCISSTAEQFRKTNSFNNDEAPVLAIDMLGFWRAVVVARKQFIERQSGHFVGVSSTSGLIGAADAMAYCASKAFMQRYMEGLRNYMKQHQLPVIVTDIIPGYVDVEYQVSGDDPNEYWAITSAEAGKQIFDAIKSKKEVVYVAKRWRLIAWLYQIVPAWLYNAIGGF
jgi:short-subunit dehydrogenase